MYSSIVTPTVNPEIAPSPKNEVNKVLLIKSRFQTGCIWVIIANLKGRKILASTFESWPRQNVFPL